MNAHEFSGRLSARAAAAGILVSADAEVQLKAYFELLSRWNGKINLTALPLRDPTDETFDRLLIEPIVAAEHVAEAAKWDPLESTCRHASLSIL